MLYYHFITDHLTFCRPWIVHYCPKYIKVLTCAVKAQFLGKSELEMELVDAVIRRFKQVDDELYVRPARWRHFVESLISWCILPVRLAGSYRCWFVKKYCWLVCVREKYCSG